MNVYTLLKSSPLLSNTFIGMPPNRPTTFPKVCDSQIGSAIRYSQESPAWKMFDIVWRDKRKTIHRKRNSVLWIQKTVPVAFWGFHLTAKRLRNSCHQIHSCLHFGWNRKKKTTKATFGVRENQSLHHNLWKGLKKIKSTERKRLGTLLHTLKGLLRGTCSKPFFQLWQVMGTFWKISFLSDSVCCYQWPYSRLGSEWDRSREDEGAPRPHRGSRGALPRDSGLSSPISFCSVARSSTLPARLDPLAPHSPALPDQSNLAAPIHLPGKWGFLQKLSF